MQGKKKEEEIQRKLKEAAIAEELRKQEEERQRCLAGDPGGQHDVVQGTEVICMPSRPSEMKRINDLVF